MMMSAAVSSTPPQPAPPVATAAGWLAVLQEDNEELRHVALLHLYRDCDALWHEIAPALPDLEAIAEEPNNRNNPLAAALASRVLFHLQEQPQALKWALLTVGTEYDCFRDASSPFTSTLIAAALDAYIALLQQQQPGSGVAEASSTATSGTEWTVEQLRPMVHRLLQVACENEDWEYAVGIALEAWELPVLKDILQQSGPSVELLRYTTRSVALAQNKEFRTAALTIIAQFWKDSFLRPETIISTTEGSHPSSAAAAVCFDLVPILHTLQAPDQVAQVFQTLLSNPQEEIYHLTALQIAFLLQDTGHHAFVQAVAQDLERLVPAPSDSDTAAAPTTTTSTSSVLKVLTGGFASELKLSFLHKHNKADRLIMEQLKKGLESSSRSNSILHNAAVMTHSYLYCGTTNDSFLRDYLDWMKKASNWAKFSATASLGVVHASHVTEARQLLEPYLPPTPDAGTTVSPAGGYAEGGSLYALGLIHGTGCAASHSQETTSFLRQHLRASHANEVIAHGAALGVGLTAMGTADFDIIQELKELLDTDSAVAGEAAGLAIGMVLMGTGAGNTQHQLKNNNHAEEINDVVAELKNYARETQHEKIIRGIAMGLALMNFGQEEHADATIEELRSDRDPVLRYGAQYAIALAYCGTGSNKAIRILLHTAVSDVSDDVRMAAVIGLAFVLYQTPERVPELVKLLLESFNPHVRYASCMAVGIAMAGSGDAESVTMLEPMLDDMTDYVRQGALIGTAMIYMQQSDTCNGRKIRTFREKLASIIAEKHQSTLTKMGAILATGILDAGGRNCALQLGCNGFTKITSAVGLALWLQHWHWFPLMHMFSLALTPTLTIGLNKNFKYPKGFEIVCHAKPSQFAYPKKMEEKKEKEKKRVETVTLSITAKEKARLARKKAKEGGAVTGGDSMDVDADKVKKVASTDEDKEQQGAESMDVDDDENKATSQAKKKREPEPTMFKVGNPARITKAQSAYCEFDFTQRYRPVRASVKPFGIIILTDSTPDEEEDVLAIKPPSMEPEGELAPPEPFEWTPPPPPLPVDNKEEESTEEKSGDEKPSDASSIE